MRIEKEVFLPASVDEIWPVLNDIDRLQSFCHDNSESWRIIESKPFQKVSITTDRLPSTIVTSFEISVKGKRVSLKVTVSGWETIDKEKSLKELPRLSLAWEQRLNIIKNIICRDHLI